MLGWWAQRPAVTFKNAAGVRAGAATGGQTANYTHSTSVALSQFVVYLAMPGSYSGGYNWVATVDGAAMRYIGYAPIANNAGAGVVAMYLASNIGPGAHAMSATVTAGVSDSIASLYMASVAYEAVALTGTMSWWVNSTQAVSFSDATNLPPGNKLISGLYADGIMSTRPTSNPSGIVTRYTSSDSKFHIYETPTSGGEITWSGNQTAVGGWAVSTTGIVA